jgi:TatD DNase family protein
MSFIDTHAHIYHKEFSSDIDEILQQCLGKGVNKIYMPNISEDSVEGMLALSEKYPNQCFPMLGIHPCDVTEDVEKVLDRLRKLYANTNFIAVGETGLDLYWDKSTFELQKRSLTYHMQWAIEEDLPIVLHTRNAMDETIEMVRPYAKKGLRGVFHCFNGNKEQAQQIITMNLYLGIGGVLTFKNSGLDIAIKDIDMKHLVLETDAPYLSPVPHRGKRNSPEYIPLVAQKLAEIKGISVEEVGRITSENALNLFEPNKA